MSAADDAFRRTLPRDAERRAGFGLDAPAPAGVDMLNWTDERASLETLPIYERTMQPDEPAELRLLALHKLMLFYADELDRAGGDRALLDPHVRLLEAQVDIMWRGEPLLPLLVAMREQDRQSLRGKIKGTAADPRQVAAAAQDVIDADPKRHGAKDRAFKAVAAMSGMPSWTTVRNLYYGNGGEEGERHAQRARRLEPRAMWGSSTASLLPPDVDSQRASDDGMPEFVNLYWQETGLIT